MEYSLSDSDDSDGGSSHDNEHMANLRVTSLEDENPRMPSVGYNRSAPDRIQTQKQLDAIWCPAQSRDLIVHLKMDVYEDLTETLEEFHFFERLGDFVSARKHFEEHLADHYDDEYVLVQYCEMLLEQGDYLSVLSKLDSHSLYGPKFEQNGSRFLNEYLHLILFFTKCHYILRRPGDFSFNKETLRLLREAVSENQRDITSTEVKYLALLYRLCGLRRSEVTKKRLIRTLSVSFPPQFHRKLYESLLRQGRIWDLRDIIIARMATGSLWKISADWSIDPDFRVRLYDLVAQWTNPNAERDTPTLLGLLDILTSFIRWDDYGDITPDILTVATKIARSIVDSHPEAMKTRPFIQWILVQCGSAEPGSRDQLEKQENHLDNSPGILYRRTSRNLPQYAPYKTETPGWVCQDGPPELQNSARMALKTSIARGDYQTQAKALQLLILMSSNPVKECEELGKLQNLTQGDNYNFAETLATKYLVSSDDASREKLRVELASHRSILGFSSGLSTHQLWVLSRIRYALARDSTEAKYALNEADNWYNQSPFEFIQYVDRKIPRQRNVSQRNNEVRIRGQGSTEVRATENLRGEDSDYKREELGELGSRLGSRLNMRRNSRSETSAPTIIDTRVPGLNTIWPPTASRIPREPATEPEGFPSEGNSTHKGNRPPNESAIDRGSSLSRDVRGRHVPRSRKQPNDMEDGNINTVHLAGYGTSSNARRQTNIRRITTPSRAVTMEIARDVEEDSESLGSFISTTNDSN